VTPSATQICLLARFQPEGSTSCSTGGDPTVIGIGYAAIVTVSFLKHEPRDSAGNANPVDSGSEERTRRRAAAIVTGSAERPEHPHVPPTSGST
jgi:hypothetical protein